MRIFLSYGFNPRDQWVPDLVRPLLAAMGAEILTGEGPGGQTLSNEILERIGRCQGLIGFTTRRTELAGGGWTTHHWVKDELTAAYSQGLKVVEVREEGVADVGGLIGSLPRLSYQESRRDECLVGIAQVFGRWRQRTPFRLQLLPEEFQRAVRAHLSARRVQCICEWMDDIDADVRETPVDLVPRVGGVFTRTPALPPTALVRLRVRCPEGEWVSNFETVDALNVHLTRG